MNTTLLLILAIVFVLIAVKLLALLKTEQKSGLYQRTGRLLSNAELSFFKVLSLCIPDGYRIFAKVRLCDLVNVKRRGQKKYYQAFNKISSKHVDFVICLDRDSTIVGVVELDDKSHESAARHARDQFIDNVMKETGIPILHVKAAGDYNAINLKEIVQSAFWPVSSHLAEDCPSHGDGDAQKKPSCRN